MKKITLEEANEIALKNGYHSYGEFRQELYRHNVTLEEFVKNGNRFEKKKSKKETLNEMPECVFNAITKRIIELKEQKADLSKASTSGKMKQEIKKQLLKIDQEMRQLEEYQRKHSKYAG